MHTITFYRQARNDGGIRTGVEVDGATAAAHFEKGRTPSDPALLWYVDVQCSAKRLPTDPDAAQQWLVEHRDAIVKVIAALAEKVPAGYDPDDWPLRLSRTIGGVNIRVSCSAVRRQDARQIARILDDIATHWSDRLQSLEVLPAA